MKNKSKGFTLVEIVILVGILAVFVSIGFPAFRKFYPRIQLNTVSRDIVFKLRETQQFAISEQVIHLLRFDTVSESYTLIKLPDPLDPGTEEIIEINYLPSEVSFDSINGLTDNEVRYNSAGAPSDSGTLVLTSSAETTSTVDIRPSGYVKSY